MSAEETFRLSFAAALVSALQENETKTLTAAEKVEETYVKLCHDDPYELDVAGCELLAEELLKPHSAYALSNRFVQGLDQVLRRPSDNTNSSMDRAVSYLAWTVHVRIPLACLNACSQSQQKSLDEKLSIVKTYMGSYRGNPLSEDDETDTLLQKMSRELHIAEDRPASEQSEENNPENDCVCVPKTVKSSANQETDSLEEVWAAESDPDDFEFESGYDYQNELKALDEWAEMTSIHPHELSKAPIDTTWSDIAIGIVALLTPVRYSTHLVALSNKDWKDSWQSCWTPLIMSLLVLPDQIPDCPLWQRESTVHLEFQKLGFHFAQIARDAASDRPELLMGPYIELLQNLLQVQTAQKQQTSHVLTAAWVGLGSFSALCDSTLAQAPKYPPALRQIQNGIIESCEQLTLVLERSLGDSPTYCAVQWSYISLMRILSVDPVSKLPVLGSTHGQLLLQSGLFRQWLLNWLNEQNSENAEVMSVHRLVHQALWELCAASPTLLGKYAWRFPDVAPRVTNNGNVVDILLWNILGIHLSKSDSPKLKLRNSVAVDPPSTAECQSAAWSAFQTLCQNIESILRRWRKKVEHDGVDSEIIASLSEENKTEVYDVKEFGRFVGVLTKSQLACKLFLEEMVPMVDGKQPITILKACVQPLRDVLQTWPPQNMDSSIKAEQSDDEKDVNVSARKRQHPLPIQEIRHDIKTLSTIFLNQGEGARSSSKSD